MKTTLLVLFFLCATVAFGQSSNATGALSNEPMVIQFMSHPGHAAREGMGQEQTLLDQSVNIQARGVRPLWEVAVPSQLTPLGDSARLLRKEHAAAKKSEVVWTN